MHRRYIALIYALFYLAALPAAAAPQYTQQDLGTLTPGGTVQPQGINQAGQVFGGASSSTTNLSLPNHIFFWSPQGGMIDIGALPDNRPASAYPAEGSRAGVAMNDLGQIIGEAEVDANGPGQGQFGPTSHAFLWTPASGGTSGVIQDLGTLGTPSIADLGTTAVAINNHGQVIGTANALTLTAQGYLDINYPHGFLWTPGGTNGVPSNPNMQDLGLLQPSLIDNTGHVFGLINGVITLYTGSSFVSLGDPPGFTPTGTYLENFLFLVRMDAQGDIYGYYLSESGTTPFIWIPSLPGGTTGQYIVGGPAATVNPQPGSLTAAELPADAQVIWANGGLSADVFAFDPKNHIWNFVDLGGLEFDTIYEGNPNFPSFDTYPNAWNAAGDLIGECSLPTGSSIAFLEQTGLMYDLNLHIVGAGAGSYYLLNTSGINNSGQIVVLGQPLNQPSANLHAFLLTPAGQAAPATPTVQLIQPQPPDQGDPDQFEDIKGTGFEAGAVVTYDGTPLKANVYAESQITTVVPMADLTPGMHTITVTNPDGRAGSAPYMVLPIRPVPTLATISPGSLPAGSPATVLTLTGTGLYPESQVIGDVNTVTNVPLPILSTSADHTQVTVQAPASMLASGARITFTVSTPGERGASVSYTPPVLTVVNPVPTVSSISPSSFVADTDDYLQVTLDVKCF